MILKVLLIAVVIGVVYSVFIKKREPKPTEESSKRKDESKANDMVQCAFCGVYSELNECILSGSNYYCSSECATKAK